MGHLKYYAWERQRLRNKGLMTRKMGRERIGALVAKFCETYSLAPIPVAFTGVGGSAFHYAWTKPDETLLVFGGNAYPLVVLHELAHALDFSCRLGQIMVARFNNTPVQAASKMARIIRQHWHGPAHTAYMDLLVEWYGNLDSSYWKT